MDEDERIITMLDIPKIAIICFIVTTIATEFAIWLWISLRVVY